MNYWWLVSGAIAVISTFIHLFMGQAGVIKPFLKCDLDAIPMAVLHVCWHIVSVILFVSAIMLLYLGANPISVGSKIVALFIGGQFVAYAILFLTFSFLGNWSNKLFVLPQWTLLLPIGVLAIIGCLAP
ncbi:MAG: hypothetical protein GY865_18955 [candidate division Zixibacteria bacterium]|nr:hypothetical protein [candidate division Zixibacteria bacterium]